MPKTVNATILSRSDDAAAWTVANPILSRGEIGIEIDTFRLKIGDGTTRWNNLQYATE